MTQGIIHQHRASPLHGVLASVPLGVDLPAAMSSQTRPDERVVVGQHLAVETFTQAPQQDRGALDVGEQERERLHGPSLGG